MTGGAEHQRKAACHCKVKQGGGNRVVGEVDYAVNTVGASNLGKIRVG